MVFTSIIPKPEKVHDINLLKKAGIILTPKYGDGLEIHAILPDKFCVEIINDKDNNKDSGSRTYLIKYKKTGKLFIKGYYSWSDDCETFYKIAE